MIHDHKRTLKVLGCVCGCIVSMLLFVPTRDTATLGAFVPGGGSLPATKHEAKSCINPDPTKCLTASDFNAHTDALYDLRSANVRCTTVLTTATVGPAESISQDVACVGAVINSECAVGGPSTLEAGLFQTCLVVSTGHVQIRTANLSGNPVTLAGSQIVSVRVFSP